MQQKQDYVNTIRYTSNLAVGGPGGHPYSLFAEILDEVKQVTFYRDSSRIRGISFERYSGASIKVFGNFDDKTPVVFNFAKDEQLTWILLYSNSSFGDGRFAGLKINTTRQSLEAFAYGYQPSESEQVEIPVGNGRWNAIFGKAGGDIDSFGMGMRTGDL